MFALGSPLVESYGVKRLLVCMQVTSGTSASAYKTAAHGGRSLLPAGRSPPVLRLTGISELHGFRSREAQP